MRLLCSICLILISCHSKSQQESVSEPSQIVNVVDVKKYKVRAHDNYSLSRQTATYIRARLKKTYDSTTDNSIRQAVLIKAEKELTNVLTSSIIPFWYGTPWDFNGYTDVPGRGDIACGYFVSTTLLHSGFNLNRYTLAQQSGFSEAKSLCIEDSLITLENVEAADIYKILQDRGHQDGLYFVGLDFHVGYLLMEEGNLFFLHSNYVARQGVTIEPVEESLAFHSSVFIIVPISSNKSLIKKWLNNEPIKIVKDQ